MAKEKKGHIVSNANTENGDWNARHDKFQGHNPMLQTEFERELCAKEKAERHMAKIRYQLGIQGVDGGRFPRAQS
jgi:hypothetical protein